MQEVRHWTQNGVTRVAVQLNGQAEVRRDRLFNPERYFFDFQQTVPARKGMQTIAVGDSLVRQIRIAEAKPGVARVVLDLVETADVVTTELTNPYRLMIEVKRRGYVPPSPAPEPVISAAPAKPYNATRTFVPPFKSYPVLAAAILPPPPALLTSAKLSRTWALPQPFKVTFPGFRSTAAARSAPPRAELPRITADRPAVPSPARRGTSGANSLTRALGLKIRRVVLDPGHGGHDQGSSGPTGLLEKELVLDVGLRLGELISNNLGSEVVYTRADDRFVPLENRTRIANDSRADLFVSIHANSSTIRSVTGVETYFLSFTNSKEALDVAARENATSERSVFELRDLLQKIAQQEKIDESRDFAVRVNAALYRVWGQAGAARNRGVKKAPFVVLIGASMPSILTEIGFLSNPRDEKELRKPETRQKIAEALFKGISQYADSLSHFAVARRAQDEE
ncbi:MAG: N-acetylmuramoyl-L-alanine amidase [Bryobacteraceae bacterium]